MACAVLQTKNGLKKIFHTAYFYDKIDGYSRNYIIRKVTIMLENTEEIVMKYIKELFGNDGSGHDYCHTIRVYNNAVLIAKNENWNILKMFVYFLFDWLSSYFPLKYIGLY